MTQKSSFVESLRFEEAWGTYQGEVTLGDQTVTFSIEPNGDLAFLEQSESLLNELLRDWKEILGRISTLSQAYLLTLGRIESEDELLPDSLTIFSLTLVNEDEDSYYAIGAEVRGVLTEDDYINFESDFKHTWSNIDLRSFV